MFWYKRKKYANKEYTVWRFEKNANPSILLQIMFDFKLT